MGGRGGGAHFHDLAERGEVKDADTAPPPEPAAEPAPEFPEAFADGVVLPT